MFALAGHLHMTVGELCQRMDSRELTEWIAYTRYFSPFADPWRQTGLVVSSLLAPHIRDGKVPAPNDFVPTLPPPQHEEQDRAALRELQKSLGVE